MQEILGFCNGMIRATRFRPKRASVWDAIYGKAWLPGRSPSTTEKNLPASPDRAVRATAFENFLCEEENAGKGERAASSKPGQVDSEKNSTFLRHPAKRKRWFCSRLIFIYFFVRKVFLWPWSTLDASLFRTNCVNKTAWNGLTKIYVGYEVLSVVRLRCQVISQICNRGEVGGWHGHVQIVRIPQLKLIQHHGRILYLWFLNGAAAFHSENLGVRKCFLVTFMSQ